MGRRNKTHKNRKKNPSPPVPAPAAAAAAEAQPLEEVGVTAGTPDSCKCCDGGNRYHGSNWDQVGGNSNWGQPSGGYGDYSQEEEPPTSWSSLYPDMECETCPVCHLKFDGQQHRRLQDTCGHARCYNCMVQSSMCPLCHQGNADENRRTPTAPPQMGSNESTNPQTPQKSQEKPDTTQNRPPPPQQPNRATASGTNSISGHWRTQGNSHYKAALSFEIPRQKRESLDKAITAYHKALSLADVQDETTSAAKNLAMANWKMAELLEETEERLPIRRFYYGEAIKYFSISLARADGVKPEAWVDALMQSYDACVQSAMQKSSAITNTSDRVIDLEGLIHKMEESTYKADVYIELGQVLFTAGVTALQDGDFRKALSFMRDCYRPIEEAKVKAREREHILAEVRVLESDVYLHHCSAESMQARHQGDTMLEDLLLNEEYLNMDMVYEVIDWFKKAILLTKEVEVEMEAIALSRLGHVYDKVLKDKAKAKTNFTRCIQLAHSMHPRTFHSQTWYQVCHEALERYQNELKDQEDSVWQKEREKFMKELEKELKLLKEKSDLRDKEFLLFVYEEFPPKRKTFRIANLDKKEECDMKKTLQTAVTHFHPDRVNVTEWGKKYKVLMEEICKELTSRYECRKGDM